MVTDVRSLPAPPRREQPRLLRALLRDPQPVLSELRERLGPVFSMGAGPMRLVIVGDPAALREMFATTNEAFRWGHKFNVLGFVVGSGSMIVSDGEDHRRRRSSVQAAFSRRRLNGWIPMIIERTDSAVDNLVAGARERPGEPVDLAPVGRSLVLDVVVRALFGARMAARVDEIGMRFERPQRYLEGPAWRQVPHRLPFTRRARVRADRRALDAIIDREIAALRSHPVDEPLDVLATLVADATLSDAEIRDQVISLIGAGYDTTSATLSWMLWCCATTPGTWAALRAEADAVFPHVTGDADATTLAGLAGAGRVVRETTRLHPAGAFAPRQAARDVVIAGYRIRRGTLILWSPFLAGRDPQAWSEPLRFSPERFVAMSEDQRVLADIAWVPFGRGARNCIGFALAQMELTLIIARLAQRLDVVAVSGDVPRPFGMVVNRPAGGVPMLVAERAPR